MNRILLAVAVVLTGLSGCATPARYVDKSGDSGIVAIPANTDSWPMHYRAEAVALIEKHVGPGYEIVEEKEVAVGQQTNNNQQVKREKAFNPNMPYVSGEKDTITNTTTTHDVTEYRIAYRKKPMIGGPMPAGMPGGPNPFAPVPAGGVTPGVVPAVGVGGPTGTQ